MENNYFVKNMVERISRGDFTYFLTETEKRQVIALLSKQKKEAHLYKPYREAEKSILWVQRRPPVSVYEIESKHPLNHAMILGTLYAHSIKKEFYGDILIGEKNYIILLKNCEEYILHHIDEIGKGKVHFRKAKFSEIESYEREVIEICIKVTSNRMDAILSKLLKKSRTQVEDFFSFKQVFQNDEVLTKSHTILKEKDTFSIKGYGKYKCLKILFHNEKYEFYLQKYNN